ncbi:MAG: hypothetical protein GVY13_12540 [Alphaproteobacteria bacterium]|jgi:hypothetical protein|nr:hypothetical protein [Alphaproteobacteria bacterium]
MTIHIGFEAKGIQTWILAGGRLKDIAGASEIIEKLCTNDLQNALWQCGLGKERDPESAAGRPVLNENAGSILTAAAGRFRLVIRDDDKAGDFLRLWPLVVAESAPGLRFAFAAVREGESAASPTAAERLNDRLDESANLPEADFPVATPLVLRSQRTGLPVVGISKAEPDENEDPEAVDAATAGKRQVVNSRRTKGREVRLMETKFNQIGKEFATKTGPLEQAGPNAFAAFVHADANRMGQIFIGLNEALHDRPDGEKLISKLSATIGKITESVARKALKSAIGDAGAEAGELPARPVVLGGDDVTVVLPADRGLTFAEVFLNEFAEGTRAGLSDLRKELADLVGAERQRRLLPDILTAAAGIAFVHSHYPAAVAHRLSDDLCKAAKKPFRSPAAPQRSALAFHRVTASAVDSYDDILKNELTVKEGWDRPLRLTMGPYLVTPRNDQFEDGGHPTVQALHALHDVATALPRGSWRELVTLCYEGQNAAKHRYQRILEVASKAGYAEAADRLVCKLESLGCMTDTFWRDPPERDPPREDDERPCLTPVLDVAALMALERAVGRDEERRGDAA